MLALLNKTGAQFSTRQAVRDTAGHSLTYGELHQAANRLARLIRSRTDVNPGTLIALYVDRSVDTVVAMLGIMKAGAGFVPIDPAYPKARIEYILEQSQAALLISEKSLTQSLKFSDRPIIYLDDLAAATVEFSPDLVSPHPQSNGEDIAYVIFTSGTTGNPKGVLVPHRAATAFLEGMIEKPGLSSQDRFLTNASISFDMTIYEVFLPLVVGAEVVMTTRDVAGDGDRLVQVLRHYEITSMIATPSTWRLILNSKWPGSKGFKAVCGGEAFPRDLANQLLERADTVWNIYGPTETTVICLVEQVTPGDQRVLLGFPTRGTKLYIVDRSGQLVTRGAIGELLIGGPQVSLGYFNDPERTAEKFIPNSFHDVVAAPILYRSGDLVCETDGGNLEYHGRIDHQVKIRGYRVELGEIETTLARWTEIQFNHVLVREDHPEDKRIIAYVSLKDQAAELSLSALKSYLRDFLPDYMVPHHIMVVTDFPMTANGKVDISRLPPPHTLRAKLIEAVIPPRNKTEEILADTFAAILQFDRVGIDDDLFAMGLNSLLATRAIAELRAHQINLHAAEIYEHLTIARMSEHLVAETSPATPPNSPSINSPSINSPSINRKRDETSGAIAIIGMAGRFPKCPDVETFWKRLCRGEEAIDHIHLDSISREVPPEIRDSPDYVPFRGIVHGIEDFDAKFFGIPPSEAAMIDPQQRVFLEECWHALEDSGHDPETHSGKIGIFAGMHRSSYFSEVHRQNPAAIENFGDFNSMVATEKDYIATRVAHRLNLTGPAVSVHTACSTSLVAIIQAVNALRLFQCDMALAGGASINVPQNTGHLYQEDNIQTKDGHCRPFASDATGTIFSDGVGAIVLKRLEDATADRDQIYAVIRGVGINNDGREKSSFMAPSKSGQLACIRAAMEDAGVHPHQVSHVEAHGTGTIIGDPIETGALKASLTVDGPMGNVSIGSIKGNFGHMVAAAGVASVIKTALALQSRTIPPSINADKLNQDCGFDERFTVNRQLKPWPAHDRIIAGVSSFGVGGTNAHIIMERHKDAALRGECPTKLVLLPFSAKTASALERMGESIKHKVSQLPSGWARADAAWTMQMGRQQQTHRSFFIVQNGTDSTSNSITCAPAGTPIKPGRISASRATQEGHGCWIFPGQGAQYAGMAAALYYENEMFRQSLDDITARLSEKHGIDIKSPLISRGRPDNADDSSIFRHTSKAQPAIFAVSLALAQTWKKLGLTPAMVIGHSIGEFVAAVISGIMSQDDATDFIAERARITSGLPTGAMLAVKISAQEMTLRLAKNCDLAAINGPQQVVVSGPDEAILGMIDALHRDHIKNLRLETSHAFHSQMMTPAVEALTACAARLNLTAPAVPFYSTVKGRLLTDHEAVNPHYWGTHVRETVNFNGAIDCVKYLVPHFLEIGPRAALSGMIRHITKEAKAISSLSPSGNPSLDYESFLKAVGQLWQGGSNIQWMNLSVAPRSHKISMPQYPFERQRHWLLR